MTDVRRIATWARWGYAARGLVYVLLGWIAFASGRALSTGDAVQQVEALPAGTLLLAFIAAGLFFYGLYKIYNGIVDLDGQGSEAKGKVVRIARVAGGLSYWLLAIIALRALLGDGADTADAGQPHGSAGTKQDVAGDLQEEPGGGFLLILAGIAVLAMAAGQFVIAARAKFMKQVGGDAPRWLKPAGQVGYAARALVVTLVGWSVLKAGAAGERVRDFGDALALLRSDSGLIFQMVALGLILFGIASLMMARYLAVRDEDVVDRLKTALD